MAPYTETDHNNAITALSSQVSSFSKSFTPFRINHGSTNSTRSRDPCTPQLDIAHLDHILGIDIASKHAIVEPNVPLDALLSASLKHGLMPPVVMEFPGITVGGGFSGASGESSSWKEGLFDCCVEEVEVVLGNGDVVRAIKGGANAELFDAARCSLGTLGVVTLLKVRLVEAKDRVLLHYERLGSVKATIDRIAELCESDDPDFDFIEGLLYSKTNGVIVTGRLISSTSPSATALPLQRFDRAIDPWFYQHVQSIDSTHSEVVPTSSYLFRYDRGAFWGGDTMFSYFGLPNNRATRFLFNGLTKTRAIYKAMLSTGSADFAVIQDLLLPAETSEAFVDYIVDELGIWPLWICPVRKKAVDGDVWGWPFWKHEIKKPSPPALHKRYVQPNKGALTLNFGVWGAVGDDSSPSSFRAVNRRMEDRLRDLRGMKVPYAAQFYTEDEFWALYDRPRYEELRRKWHAEALPSVYDKIKRAEVKTETVERRREAMGWRERLLWVWPFGGLYQLWCVVFK